MANAKGLEQRTSADRLVNRNQSASLATLPTEILIPIIEWSLPDVGANDYRLEVGRSLPGP